MSIFSKLFKCKKPLETDRQNDEAIKQSNAPSYKSKKSNPNRRKRRFFIYGKKRQITKERIRRLVKNKAKRRKANKLARVKRRINK